MQSHILKYSKRQKFCMIICKIFGTKFRYYFTINESENLSEVSFNLSIMTHFDDLTTLATRIIIGHLLYYCLMGKPAKK